MNATIYLHKGKEESLLRFHPGYSQELSNASKAIFGKGILSKSVHPKEIFLASDTIKSVLLQYVFFPSKHARLTVTSGKKKSQMPGTVVRASVSEVEMQTPTPCVSFTVRETGYLASSSIFMVTRQSFRLTVSVCIENDILLQNYSVKPFYLYGTSITNPKRHFPSKPTS